MANKSKKVNRQRERVLKKRRAQRRKKMVWLGGAGFLLVVLAFFTFSGGEKKAPISEGLSNDQIAALPSAPEIGSRAPDFTLADVDGNAVTLSEVSGKPMAIMFFHTW